MRQELKFQLEHLTAELWKEFEPHFRVHYAELAHFREFPLDPDIDRYLQLENTGALRVYTARDSGALIGYAFFFLSHNGHYVSSGLWAVQDLIWLAPKWRGSGVGSRLISFCDEQLKAAGCAVITQHLKAAHSQSFGPLLERKGYELVDLIYAKRS